MSETVMGPPQHGGSGPGDAPFGGHFIGFIMTKRRTREGPEEAWGSDRGAGIYRGRLAASCFVGSSLRYERYPLKADSSS